MTIDRRINRTGSFTARVSICLPACLCAAMACSACSDMRTHKVDPGDNTLVLTCPTGQAPRSANIARIVANNGYWVSWKTRDRMLEFAKETCGNGSLAVRFVLVPGAPSPEVGEPRQVALSETSER